MNLIKLKSLWCRERESWEKLTSSDDVDCERKESEDVVFDLDRVAQFHSIENDGTTGIEVTGSGSFVIDMTFDDFCKLMIKKGYQIDDTFYR